VCHRLGFVYYLILVVSTSATDCFDRINSEMTYYVVLARMVNSTHSLQLMIQNVNIFPSTLTAARSSQNSLFGRF